LISWSHLGLTNWSWDQNSLIMLYFNFDLMIKVSTSWSKLSNINEQIRPHEQIEFWPHYQKFDLLKKLNFDLMKFDLMIISHNSRILSLFPLVYTQECHNRCCRFSWPWKHLVFQPKIFTLKNNFKRLHKL